MTFGDIYYALFRHKWKIIICSLVGFFVAGAYLKLRPPPFQSEAKLFIAYVMESQGTTPTGGDVAKPTDPRGETIINTELEILTSVDLAEQVAKTIGPDKIVGQANALNALPRAIGIIQKNLLVDVTRSMSVIHLVFKHPDPVIAQSVLTEIIDVYRKRHIEIHRTSGMLNVFLARETDELRDRLAQTEEELRKAKNKAGIISLDDSKKQYATQIARLREEISTAQAELAERSSLLNELAKQSPSAPWTSQNPSDSSPEPTPEQIKQYRNLVSREDSLFKREQELLTWAKEDTTRVRELHAQLVDVQVLKKNLEDSFPKLARSAPPTSIQQTANPNAQVDPLTEKAHLTALETKIKVLNSQLEATRAEAANTDQNEATILQLMRQKELEEANYKNYSTSLERARTKEAMGSDSVSNISQLQTPSRPFADWSKSVKIIGGLAASGIVFGLAWAFLIELYLDRSVRRPIDVERLLQLPLFLSIPKLNSKEIRDGGPKLLSDQTKPAETGAPSTALATQSNSALAPWDSEHALHPFHETLRDRLIGYFESKGLTHKPKLVAVTGLGRNGGVTTIAAGLASSLSETGDGNVLLVDMTQGQGSAQQFYQGKAVCGLEEILDARNSAQIEPNLFVVGQDAGGEKLSRILPHRFNKLIPKLKASNFDYIIFDMPPVSQISITPRLAGFMDMVLLVIESEKTDRDLVQRATALLAESKAHVGAVLNKTKTYVPQRLHQDNLGNT